MPAETISYPRQDLYYASGGPPAQLHFMEELDLNPGLSHSRELSSACIAAWPLRPGPLGSAHSPGAAAAWPQLGTAGVSGLYPLTFSAYNFAAVPESLRTVIPLPVSTGPSLAPGPSEDLDDNLKILWTLKVLLIEAKAVP